MPRYNWKKYKNTGKKNIKQEKVKKDTFISEKYRKETACIQDIMESLENSTTSSTTIQNNLNSYSNRTNKNL